MKPSVFIASSREAAPVAYALQELLEHDGEITVWDQGVFQISLTNIESLEEALETTEFAIIVFAPDDSINIRGEELETTRDNVILELGMFIGRLGRRRTFIVKPDRQNKLRIPTDLLGVGTAGYEPERLDRNMKAALGPAANKIRNQLSKLSSSQPDGSRRHRGAQPPIEIRPLGPNAELKLKPFSWQRLEPLHEEALRQYLRQTEASMEYKRPPRSPGVLSAAPTDVKRY